MVITVHPHNVMKHSHTFIAAIVFATTTVTLSQAATIIPGYENLGTDGTAFLYEAKATFSANDLWSTTAEVGGWSYVDLDPAKNQNRGWGHASAWYLLEILTATNLQLMLSSTDSSARPGYVIYAGESVEDTPANAHSYSNNGNDLVLLNDGWDNNGPAGAPGLAYLSNAFNASTNSLIDTVYLSPGLYTLAIGNGADSRNTNSAKTYDLTLTTVPEPTALTLTFFGAVIGFCRRRR